MKPPEAAAVDAQRAASEDDRIHDVRRLLHEHLTASMIMVRLDEPLPAEMRVADALAYMERNDFDLALLSGSDVRLVYRSALAAHPHPGAVLADVASPARVDRLVEHTLELGEVARRLHDDDVRLLIVGRRGPQYLVTRADFTRPAGQAAALAILATLDSQLDELLRPYEADIWPRVSPERKDVIEGRVAEAQRRNEDVGRMSYLTFGERLAFVRVLDVGRRAGVDLGSEEEHVRLARVRNDIAHGRTPHGSEIVVALETAERILDSILIGKTRRGPE